MSTVLVRSAAGCGKTTELARRYLGFVADGIPVEQAVAITFTRRAAAELVERVTLALRATLDGPIAEEARERLGSAWPIYASVAPTDAEVSRRALASLPSAPIGTTDRFVHALLTEHALFAAVPVPGGEPAPIDVPITPTAVLGRHLERAARRVLDPPGGGVDPDVELLVRYFGLDEILGWLSSASPYDTLPIARTRDVMGFVATHLAEVIDAHDPVAAWSLSDPTNLDAVRADLAKSTNKAGQWAVDAISAWLVAGRPAPAPFELAGWLKGLRRQGKARQAIAADLQTTTLDLGPARLSLAQIVETMRYPYDDRSHVDLADRLQEARERLRKRVVADGLTAAAAAGELDHSSLTQAAIALCENPPPRLHDRYRALLVDEIQDANPEQLDLYRALAALPSSPAIQSVMVGDVRQSIYLFRGAEPAGFADLVDVAQGVVPPRPGSTDRGSLVDLHVNFRSHPALVQAHRQLFGALRAPMKAAGYTPLDALDALQAHPSNAPLALSPAVHERPEPVWVVRPEDGEDLTYYEMNERALHAFLLRVRAAWTEPGHERDTAVVLAPSWHEARRACDRLRAWTGRRDIAHVDGGGKGLLDGPVGTDLKLLLRALLDPTDEVAWVGVWKHPMIGLTDAALARINAGTGLVTHGPAGDSPAPEWTHRVGHAVRADGLTPPHRPDDVAAFARAVGPLRQAIDGVGREDLAGVIDRLAHTLEWRVLLEAGPGGVDDVAALEVALDLIRELEAENTAPDAILAALRDPEATDLPRIQLERAANTISCMTVHQSKGLAWDHVYVVSPGRGGRGFESEVPKTAWIDLDGEPHRIVGLRFDPLGALSPFKDPVGRLGSRIGAFRHEEECARLAYVAITRARRSVTFGLPTNDARCQPLQKLCADAWADPALAGEAIAHVPWPAPPSAAHAPTGWVAPVSPAPPAPPTPVGRRWSVRQPSSYASHHDVGTRRADAELTAKAIQLRNGLHLGGAPASPPQAAHSEIRPWEWGELAHGWLAHWGFRADPSPEQALHWLRDAWALDAPDVAAWLVAISHTLARVQGPLWERVTDPKAKLRFEHPFVGVAGRKDDVILSGRIDLMVHRGRKTTVIDFKAGGRSPTGVDDLIDQGGLRTYGPQLEAYRAALITAGFEVDDVALWFVRTGTQLIW